MMEFVRLDGVTFVVEHCAKMTESEFVRKHQCFWPEMGDAERTKLLKKAYKLIKPTKAE